MEAFVQASSPGFLNEPSIVPWSAAKVVPSGAVNSTLPCGRLIEPLVLNRDSTEVTSPRSSVTAVPSWPEIAASLMTTSRSFESCSSPSISCTMCSGFVPRSRSSTVMLHAPVSASASTLLSPIVIVAPGVAVPEMTAVLPAWSIDAMFATRSTTFVSIVVVVVPSARKSPLLLVPGMEKSIASEPAGASSAAVTPTMKRYCSFAPWLAAQSTSKVMVLPSFEGFPFVSGIEVEFSQPVPPTWRHWPCTVVCSSKVVPSGASSVTVPSVFVRASRFSTTNGTGVLSPRSSSIGPWSTPTSVPPSTIVAVTVFWSTCELLKRCVAVREFAPTESPSTVIDQLPLEFTSTVFPPIVTVPFGVAVPDTTAVFAMLFTFVTCAVSATCSNRSPASVFASVPGPAQVLPSSVTFPPAYLPKVAL